MGINLKEFDMKMPDEIFFIDKEDMSFNRGKIDETKEENEFCFNVIKLSEHNRIVKENKQILDDHKTVYDAMLANRANIIKEKNEEIKKLQDLRNSEIIKLNEDKNNEIAKLKIELEKLRTKTTDYRLALAVSFYNGAWPKDLISGIMFYEGLRITKKMFKDYIKGG